MQMLKEVLNPFSEEALRIVEKAPSLVELSKSVFNLAMEKITSEHPGDLVEARDYGEDILSFHLLFAACALRYGSYSPETRLVTEITKKIISSRIGFLISSHAHYKKTYDEGVITAIFSQFFDVSRVRDLQLKRSSLADDLRLAAASMNPEDSLQYCVPVSQILPALGAGKIKLTDLYIAKGYAFLSLSALIAMTEATLEVSIKKHIERIAEKRDAVDIGELKPLVDAISRAASNPEEYLRKYQKRVYFAVSPRASMGRKSRVALKPEFFPPCIRLVLQGVSSGSRNYAITVLLTSFVSYARLAPTGSKRDAKLSDYTSDAKILEEGVLPIIFEAAEHCSPPLFADQPLEKMNIYYHLGLGMTSEARLEHAGKSNWYFPPNCDKIRREAPSLCRPDEPCREIKNPLGYYTKKLFAKKGRAKTKRKAEAGGAVKEKEIPLRGKITQIYEGSGLIMRCPECKRQILNNLCVVHGDVQGIHDLRIKAKFDDGKLNQILLLRDVAENILGITLEDAKKLGDAAVLEKIRDSLIRKNFEIQGTKLSGGNFLVKMIRRRG